MLLLSLTSILFLKFLFVLPYTALLISLALISILNILFRCLLLMSLTSILFLKFLFALPYTSLLISLYNPFPPLIPFFLALHYFFITKPSFCLSLNFLKIMLRLGWDFQNIFVNFYLFFFFSFSTNNLRNSAFPSFDLSMFAEEEGTAINNEDRQEF